MQDLAGRIMVAARDALRLVAHDPGWPVDVPPTSVRSRLAARLAPEMVGSGQAFGCQVVETPCDGAFDVVASDAAGGPVLVVMLLDVCEGREAVLSRLRDLVAASGTAAGYRMGYACLYGAGCGPGSVRNMAFGLLDAIRAEMPDASMTVCGAHAGGRGGLGFDMACVMVGRPCPMPEE